ncbi:hypothetical protein EDB81DRAFT_41253 [Dactylonectria macrodidyma]|uniref:Chitin synthase regulatory factor 3 n=1 Tax=Dactylonectria macrodidyma TaxID=307937 RepID=A0A9P9FV34_9HYPO|nr:hypothetical protein EDB81DRAFT_41253 [Dactylonectria macrodidyma]
MATYDGGYGGQQRPYDGPSPQRGAPRQYGNAPPPQQYNDYHNGNGYDNYNEGYGQDYGGQYQDQNYARGPPPPQDPYTQGLGYGGRPMPGGRGGPIHRPQTADPHRARPPPPRGQTPGAPGPGRGMHNGGPGRGGMRPGPYGAHSDPAARQPPVNSNSPISPRGGGFGGNYPPFPGQHRRSDEEIADQMSGMDLNQRPRVPEGRTSSDSQRNAMNGARGPPPRGYPAQGPSQGYPEQRRGPPPGRDPGYGAPGGYGEFDDGYNTGGQGPPRNGFGPPARSMTMPVEDQGPRNQMQPLQRTGTMPVNGRPVDRGMPPQRPSTAAGHRPPPQRMYPAEPQVPPPSQYVGEYDEAHGGYRKPPAASYDDVYDTYFDNQQNNNQGPYGSNQRQDRTSLPDFDAIPSQGGRGSFEQTMRPAHEQQHAGAHQTAQLYHAKSQPDLQPQSAVFEMVGDAPSVPPLPPMNGYQQGYDQGYPGPGGHEHLPPRGPSAPPGGRPGLPSNPGSMRSGVQPGRNPDALPSHPTPVRPGLMANSMVHMDNKPPPVRNYGNVPERGPQQQQPPPQQQPPRQASASQASVKDEPPVTPQELEHLRMVIKSNPADQESALRLARKLIEATDVLVPKLDPKQRPRARERYLIDCQKILKKLSNAQNQDAMFLMADSVGRGLFGHEPDFKEAFTMYQSAAKLGHAAAAYRTAVCCEIGHEDGGGTRKDPLKAIQWYKRAATLGDPPAMYKVGMILLKGLLGQPKNPREAVGWLKRAAERADADNPHALHELGLLYESAQPNDVIIRDEAYAYSLFVQAADLGYKFSQYRLGCSYEYGLLGCPIDPRQSIMWYSRAATQEEHQAELALSGWYLTGSEDVLGQSDTEAYLWARKAAVAGLAKAEYAMGYFTEVGIGVPANLEDAKRWYWRAAGK